MPTLNVNGHSVAVDEGFLKLSPEEQNATVDEIAKTLPAQKAAEPPPSVTADVAKSGATGALKGGIGMAGAAGDARNLLSSATDYIGNKLGASHEAVQTFKNRAYDASQMIPGVSVMSDAPSSGDIQKGIENTVGSELYKPKTTAGEYAQTAGEFLPAMLGGPESLAAKAVTRVALPAAASETAGQLTKGTAAEPYARVAGALMSPAILSGAQRAITPLPAAAERTAMVRALQGEGVDDLTAGQRTGSRPLQWAESTFGEMPFSGGRPAEMMTNQQEQFTNAALRRAGEDAPRANAQTIDNAFTRIGNDFEQVGANNHVQPDHQMVQDLVAARDEYHNLVGPNNRAPVIENTLNDIAHQIGQNGGVMTGEQYNAITSRIARQARGAKNDPQLQTALGDIRESLDDAFERTLQNTGNTADLDRLRNARREYRNLLVVEKAATGAGSNTAEGLISPSQLRGAVVNQNRRAYARGQGDFADLARAGEAVMRPLPNSGTAPRQYMQHAMSLMGGVLGGAEGGVPGAAAGLALPSVAGRVLMSRPGQAYLGNQLLAGHQPPPTPALARALMIRPAIAPVSQTQEKARQ